jgi:hypothetical protein
MTPYRKALKETKKRNRKEHIKDHGGKCIVCGSKNGRKIKMPFGSVLICYSPLCLRKLSWGAIEAMPLLWVSPEDYEDRELMKQEEVRSISPDDMAEMADDMNIRLWDDYFGNTFHDLLKGSLVVLERLKLERTPDEDIPLLAGQIKHRENQDYYNERLRKGGQING